MRSPEWSLGGPSRFVQAVSTDLEDGRSVVVVLPSKGVPSGLRAAVRSTIPEVTVNHLAAAELRVTARVVDSLYQVLALSRPRRERMHVGSFATHPSLGRRLIWVDLRDASALEAKAWGSFLRHYAAASGDVPIHLRTIFATVCDGSQAAVMPDSDKYLAKRWWWGVLTPPDTALFVFELLGERQTPPGFAEVVTEITGFDLGIASVLIEGWDGSLSSLGPTLERYDRTLVGRGSALPSVGSPRTRPTADLVPAWSAGAVNLWGDGNLRPHSCQLHVPGDADGLRHLIWRGQVRSILPWIEIERQALATWVYERRDRLPLSWKNTDIMGLEVGQLSALFNEAPDLQRNRTMAERASWLRRARNTIAHLQILDRVELDRASRIFASV